MQYGNRWIVAGLIVAGLLLSACGRSTAVKESKVAPAKVERIEGTNLKRVTLTEKAAERLGIETAPVREAAVARTQSVGGGDSGTPRKVIPYAAVIYDPQGNTWTYTNTEGLTFVRHRISVDYIEAGLAVLADGPPSGTAVVTVGGAELFGVDFGLGK
jgi:hypothetical protein